MQANPRRLAALALLAATGMRPSNYAPPLFRLLWWLGLDVPPPHFASFWSNALGTGLFFGPVWGAAMWVLFSSGENVPLQTVVLAVGGAGGSFGLVMAAYYAYGGRKYALPAWRELDVYHGDYPPFQAQAGNGEGHGRLMDRLLRWHGAFAVSRAVLLLRAAIFPTTLAWMVGTVALSGLAWWLAASDVRAQGASWLGGGSPRDVLPTIPSLLLVYGYGAAAVIFPTCLLSVAFLSLFPPAWPMWRPAQAAVLGAVLGPVALYGWAAGCRGEWYVPESFDSVHIGLAAVAALVGTTFGWRYARAVHRASR